jgi:hypothetical protein
MKTAIDRICQLCGLDFPVHLGGPLSSKSTTLLYTKNSCSDDRNLNNLQNNSVLTLHSHCSQVYILVVNHSHCSRGYTDFDHSYYSRVLSLSSITAITTRIARRYDQ